MTKGKSAEPDQTSHEKEQSNLDPHFCFSDKTYDILNLRSVNTG